MRSVRYLSLVFFSCVALSMLLVSGAQAACSNASLNGIYGLFINGYDGSGLYQHEVGQITADAKGNFTGVETVSDYGTIYNNLATTGTYSIAANCTGHGTIISVKSGNQSHYNFTFDPIANMVEAAGTDSGHGTASGYAQALGTATCSVAGIKGTYGFHGGGYVVTGGGVYQFSGQYVLDGLGKVTGNETTSINGVIVSAKPITGTYTMGSNCQGTMTYTFNAKSVNLNPYLIGGGKAFFTIETDSGIVASAVAHQ